MPQQDRLPFGREDQAMHHENAPLLQELRGMSGEYAVEMREELRLRAVDVAGRRPFGNFDTPENAAELIAYSARVDYLRGASGTATFTPPFTEWYGGEWQDKLRSRIIRFIGSHIDVTISLADDLSKSSSARLAQVVVVTITPRDI